MTGGGLAMAIREGTIFGLQLLDEGVKRNTNTHQAAERAAEQTVSIVLASRENNISRLFCWS